MMCHSTNLEIFEAGTKAQILAVMSLIKTNCLRQIQLNSRIKRSIISTLSNRRHTELANNQQSISKINLLCTHKLTKNTTPRFLAFLMKIGIKTNLWTFVVRMIFIEDFI